LAKEQIMRIRPIGPGIGGLNYSSMLQDAHTLERPVSRPVGSARRSVAVGSGPAGTLWGAIAAVARRAGQRLVEARMAQAQLMIDQAVRNYGLDSRPGRAGVRYY
jgi:hypothetical protein